MNRSIIRYILGYVLKIEAVFLLLPCLIALYYHEHEGLYFLSVAVFCGLVGILMTIHKPNNTVFYLKEGCISTALSWILLSIFGCLPFWISGEIPSFTDALFETISGFTTTGASVLSDVESLSHATLLWRSFTHWIGGMGVLVFILAIMPLGSGSNMNLMKAESPGPSVGKLVPKVKSTAQILYLIYFGMTVLQFILLLFGNMSVFEALNTAFGTAGTGGFGFRNDGFASFSPYIQWVVTIFMILFGVNFNAFYFIIFRKFRQAFGIEEIRYYFLIILSAIGIIFVDLLDHYSNALDALRHSSFQVASIITTTGYSTADFNTWSQTSKTVLVILMFVGACAGSTGGGIKVSRISIMIKSVLKEIGTYLHPKSVKKIKVDGKLVEHEVARSVNSYLITYLLLFVISIFLVSLEGRDLVTTFTSVSATLNNIGPGLELVGPTGNFGILSPLTKYVLMFDMLAGRLELSPLLLLFHPGVWKSFIQKKKKSTNE